MATLFLKEPFAAAFGKKRSANIGKHRQTGKATPATRKNPEESCREEVSELRQKLEQLQLQRVKAQQAKLGRFFVAPGKCWCWEYDIDDAELIQERRLLARHMLPAA